MIRLKPLSMITSSSINWTSIKKSPVRWAEKVKLSILEDVIVKAKKAYYTSYETLIDDKSYDILEDILRERSPKSKALSVGAPVKNKTELPFYMGSLDKIKDQNVLINWASDTNSFVVSEKLDGVSFLYLKENGKRKLFTRGDGKYGQDISAFIRHLKLPDPKTEVIRGELIITDTKFKNIWSQHFSNARNLVSGVVNSKKLHQAVKDVDAVAYEIIGKYKPLTQFKKLKSLKFKTPAYKRLDTLEFNVLVDMFSARKSKSKYTLDGLVITKNEINPVVKRGNPKHAVAFKQNLDEDAVLTEVIRIHWEHSRLGKLKPRVEIIPAQIGGVKVTFITGHNAKFIVDNKIGKGAKLLVTRSGGVIPYIQKVVKKTRPDFPKEKYEWSGVDLQLKVKSEKTLLRSIEHFFSTMGVDSIKIGNITKLYNAGYDNAIDIVWANEDDLVDILGVNGSKIYESIGKMISSKPSLAALMDASGLYANIGERRFDVMLEIIPNVLKIRKRRELLDELLTVQGWGESIAVEFIKGLPEIKKFLKRLGIKYSIPRKRKRIGALSEHTILFTGFRDKELSNQILNQGGSIAKSMTKAVTILLAPSGFSSSKTKTAKSRGVTILSPEKFIKTYLG